MTLIEAVDAARTILKDKLPSTRTFPDDSSSFYTDSMMIDWFNFAQRDIQTKLVQTFENWFVTSTSVNIVNGTEEYAMPCGCLKIIRVEDYENTDAPVEMIPISFNEKDYNYGIYDVTSNGKPCVYSIKGNRIVLRPKPTRSITNGLKMYYSRRLENIISATDTSLIPAEYHDLLVWNMIEYGLVMGEATPEAISYAVGKRTALERQLMASGENRQVQRSRTVRRKRGR